MNDRKPKLNSLLKNIGGIAAVHGNPDIEISSIEYNSKKVKQGSLFVAVAGFAADGHAYVRDAVKNGAAAVVIAEERLNDFSDLRDAVVLVTAKDTRKALSGLSAAFFGYPSSKVKVIGVTGTNGKTSITYMLESVFKEAGYTPGVIGTVNYRWKDKVIDAPNTTPESADLQEIFAGMAAEGVDVVVMEASSHALKLCRVDDIEFNMAAFTNLTRDHLDFHKTFEDYFESKMKIFHLIEKNGKDNKAAVVNLDDEYGKKIMAGKSGFSYYFAGFGMDTAADYRPAGKSVSSTIDGVRYTLEKPEGGIEVKLNLPGGFQVYNSLCAFAVCHKMGIPVDIIQKGLSALKAIPGRFNPIRSGLGFNVIVDYAHTDDAVSKLLASAKELKPGRIITLLGCGGNRDKTKRPLMGKTAVLNSDWVIFTSDNPRDEDPDEIIKDIVRGLAAGNFEIIADRDKAIKKAMYMAGKDDLIVIAGKGHENYQIIKGKKYHFDDHEVAEKYIMERGTN